jgi:aryl-alcohol dehydrogenase-like predicted oxidoreductase
METRPLGKTGLRLPVLGLGTAPLGQEYGRFNMDEALATVHTALDLGITFLDTSPYYGRGLSEVLLGMALRGVARDRYLLCSKLGRYDVAHFDFSARRVAESVDVSLHRLGVDHLDICLCHDIEFVDMAQIVEETLPALRKAQAQGKVRFIGVSGYPLKIFRYILDRAELDVVLSYCHYTLQNRRLLQFVPYLQAKEVGIINASPFGARLLSNDPLPPWHKAAAAVKEACRRAAEHCQKRGSDIAKLALQFAAQNPTFACCLAGSVSPDYLRQWVQWIEEPIDTALLAEVEQILGPALDVGYIEGRPENN